MNKEKSNTSEIRERILKGMDLAVEKLIRKKQNEDGELVFSRDGKVFIVKARELTIG